MNTKIIAIYCRDYSYFSVFADHDARKNLLKNYGYEVKFSQNLDHAVIDFTIDGENVRIITSGGRMKHYDVCIVGWLIDSADYSTMVKQQSSWCKQHHPEAPIIVVGDAALKNYPLELKDLELAGQNVFNRKMGDKLVRDVGATKYVEYSSKSGRGYKVVIDEIVFAYFSNLKDEEDRERTKKKKSDEIRQEKTKRDLFLFEKCLDLLHYI